MNFYDFTTWHAIQKNVRHSSLLRSKHPSYSLPIIPLVLLLARRSTRTTRAFKRRGADTTGLVISLAKAIPKVSFALIYGCIASSTTLSALDEPIEPFRGAFGSCLGCACDLCGGELCLFGDISFCELVRISAVVEPFS